MVTTWSTSGFLVLLLSFLLYRFQKGKEALLQELGSEQIETELLLSPIVQ